MGRRVVAEAEPPGEADQHADDAEAVERPAPVEMQDDQGGERAGGDRADVEAAQQDRVGLGALGPREPAFQGQGSAGPVGGLAGPEQAAALQV